MRASSPARLPPPQRSLLTLAEAGQRASAEADASAAEASASSAMVADSKTGGASADQAATQGGTTALQDVFTRLPGLPAALQAEALASGFHRPSCIRAGAGAAAPTSQHRTQRSQAAVAAPGAREAQVRLEQMMGRADLGRR